MVDDRRDSGLQSFAARTGSTRYAFGDLPELSGGEQNEKSFKIVAGRVVGAVFLVALNELAMSRFESSELNIVITAVILLVVLLFFPQGIVGSPGDRRRLPGFLDWH